MMDDTDLKFAKAQSPLSEPRKIKRRLKLKFWTDVAAPGLSEKKKIWRKVSFIQTIKFMAVLHISFYNSIFIIFQSLSFYQISHAAMTCRYLYKVAEKYKTLISFTWMYSFLSTVAV